jgi:bifunctional oligoribonuclease and PAP phosphatase NrnA
MIDNKEWESLKSFIEKRHRFLLTTHVHPDGDAIGSQIAMAHFLEKTGKEPYLINMDATPKYFQFLDADKHIASYDPGAHDRLIQSMDAAIVLDVSDWDRLQELGQVIKQAGIPVACVDHHIVTDQMATVQISDLDASSTGEVLYCFFQFCRAEMTPEMVDALYTSILTDTGSFRFSNTTPQTHRITADLIQHGARFQKIYQNIYETESKNRMLLKGMLLANMHFECDDRVAWFALTRELAQKTGIELWETEGFSELPRSIEKVEISLMFAESKNGSTKVSFRSKGRIPINGLASAFGGGGHKFASGATVPMKLSDAIDAVLNKTKELLQNSK